MHGSNPSTETVPDAGTASVRFFPGHRFWTAWQSVTYLGWTYLGPLIVALVVLVITLLTLDPAGDRPNLPEGPGLTTDEVLNVEAGLSLYADLTANGWGLLLPDSWYDAFTAPHYQADYPPLGRLVLAAAHETANSVWPVPTEPGDTPRWYAVQARTGSAFAFALTVLLVGVYATRWYGPVAGTIAALALPLMPRLFAHAHLASIETILGLLFTATVLVTADLWPALLEGAPHRSQWMPPRRLYLLAGGLLGLTLLTKIQAVLFPIPFSIWAVARYGRRGLVGVVGVGLVSAAVLLVGWPWLWIDPVGHAKEYFAQTTQRATLYCWYFGEKLADRAVPWHYPFVMFAVTVPVGLHLLGLAGLFVRRSDGSAQPAWRDPRLQLLLGVMLFPLVLFAVPGVTVYDGERLFLVSFPLWAVMIGRGADSWLQRGVATAGENTLPSKSRWLVVGVLLLAESTALVSLHPCQLSYYSWLVGGPRGAVALGFEPTYWADSLTRELHQRIVEEVPAGATIHVAPVLHPLQLAGMQSQAPLLQRHNIQLAAYDDSVREQVQYVLVYRRNADYRASLNEGPAGSAPPGLDRIAEIRRGGVQLAALYRVLPLESGD